MLIKCPECNKEISDKAVNCPNCGYPINNIPSNENICVIDGKEYDFTEMMKLYNQNCPFSAVLYLAKNYSFNNKKICPYISIYVEKNKCVPKKIDSNNINITKKEIDDFSSKTLPLYKKIENERKKSYNTPHCPTCNSTRIHKISATSKAINAGLFGLFGNKRTKQFHCNNCGYEW